MNAITRSFTVLRLWLNGYCPKHLLKMDANEIKLDIPLQYVPFIWRVVPIKITGYDCRQCTSEYEAKQDRFKTAMEAKAEQLRKDRGIA